MTQIPQRIKDRLMYAPITLNGKPAMLMGRLNPFATVARVGSLTSTRCDWGTAIDFSWPAVQRIIDHDNGRFKTDRAVTA